jgi:hypothetical protein
MSGRNERLDSLSRLHQLMDRSCREGAPWRLPRPARLRFEDAWASCELTTIGGIDVILSRGISATNYRGMSVGDVADQELGALLDAVVAQELGNVFAQCYAQDVDPRGVPLKTAATPR